MEDVSAVELIDKSTTEIDDDNNTFEQQIHKEMHQDITWSQILGGSIGNILEWYDFATFGLLASEIGSNFFPSGTNNHAIELLKAYGVYAGAFIMRPIGGLIFGALGDKMGRKLALQISMILMFISTFTMGCLPSYSTIGLWAPILLTLLRLFQGVSVGGQLVGSILFIVESSRPEKRGFYGGLTMLTAVLGGVVASWIVSLLNTMFNDDQMVKWGWRIPFLSSFVVAVLGIISQRHMEQSFEFVNASQHGQITKSNPIKDALKLHWKNILLIMFAVIPWCAGGYITFTFLPIYLQSQHGVKHALLVSSFLMLWKMGWLIIGGIVADKYNYYISMKIGSLILCLWSVPAYLYMKSVYIDNELNGGNDNYWPLIIADFVSGIALGLFGGPMQIFMVDSIQDVIVRYSAIGIAYNGCQAIFGGTAPLIGSALSLENFVYVGVYLTIFCGISTIILHFMSRYDSKNKPQFDFMKPDPL